MPELPEVETVRRQLSRHLPGRVVTDVDVRDPLVTAPAHPDELGLVVGCEVRRLGRRGKYLLVHLGDGARLVVHLRMTGALRWHPPGDDVDGLRFLRAVLTLDDGAHVTFCDQRRFGRMVLLPAGGDPEAYWRGRVGVEPLSSRFGAAALGTALRGRRTPVKAALLNQALVAGVGNIYADEALFEAGIHPETPAGRVGPRRVAALADAVTRVLTRGLDAGGATIRTYSDAEGGAGTMQELLNVHVRDGLPCPRCGTTIVKTRVAQRGTYLCPACQRRGR